MSKSNSTPDSAYGGLLPGQWQQKPELAKLIADRFVMPGVAIPKNPQDALSFVPRPPESMGIPGYDGIALGTTKRVSPFDDSYVHMPQQQPEFVELKPAATRVMAPPPTKDAADQPRTPGYGFDPRRSPLNKVDAAQFIARSQPLGMDASLGANGSRKAPRPRA